MWNADKVLNIAHRGASGVAPENTLSAFKKAIELCADMIEFDVHQTKDGEVVISHDKNLKRTSGKDVFIEDLTLEEVKKIDVGSWFSPEFADERIPTLKEVISLIKGKIGMNIEIKKGKKFYPDIEEKIVKILEENDLIEPCIITSFHSSCIERIKKLNPYIAIGKLFTFSIFNPKENLVFGVNALHPYWLVVSPWFVKEAHKDHLRVNVWTVNSTSVMERLVKMGVDGIITNYPDRLAIVIKNFKR